MGYDEHPAAADARYGQCALCARYGRQARQPALSPTPRRSHNTRRHIAASGVGQLVLPVPTSFQFGSREVVSRANVQTSVISATLSGLPSTIVPALSRVTEIICDTKRTVSCAERSRASAPTSSALSIETKRVSVFCSCFSRSLITASKLSYTSDDNRSFSARRSPLANASTIIS